MESVPLRYELSKDCNLIEVGKELNANMYCLALPKGRNEGYDMCMFAKTKNKSLKV